MYFRKRQSTPFEALNLRDIWGEVCKLRVKRFLEQQTAAALPFDRLEVWEFAKACGKECSLSTISFYSRFKMYG